MNINLSEREAEWLEMLLEVHESEIGDAILGKMNSCNEQTATQCLEKQRAVGDLAMSESLKWYPFNYCTGDVFALCDDHSLVGALAESMRNAFARGFYRGYYKALEGHRSAFVKDDPSMYRNTFKPAQDSTLGSVMGIPANGIGGGAK